jgi:hypothetical protein
MGSIWNFRTESVRIHENCVPSLGKRNVPGKNTIKQNRLVS